MPIARARRAAALREQALGVGHGGGQLGRSVGDRLHERDGGRRVERLGAFAQGTGQQHDRRASRARQGRDAHRRLAGEGLSVGAALAGDDEVGGLQRRGQAHQLGDDLDPGAHDGAGEAQEGGGRAARRAGTRQVGHQASGGRLDRAAVRRQRRVELVHGRRIGALLRPVCRGRTARPAERVGHVAGDHQLDRLPAAGRGPRRRWSRGRPARHRPPGARCRPPRGSGPPARAGSRCRRRWWRSRPGRW